MSAFGGKADINFDGSNVILPWRESEDLLRIEHRREPPEAATCSDAVKADSRSRG
jgi:hypothetical protein